MRYFLPTILLGMLVSSPAGASSMVPLKRADTPISPSIVYFGEPDTAAAVPPAPEPPPVASLPGDQAEHDSIAIGPSVVAVGEPEGSVEFGQVASIGEGQRQHPRNPHLPPMVIRGGIFGDPFTRPGDGPAEIEETPQQQATSPAGAAQSNAPQPAQEPERASPAPPIRRQE